MQPGYMKFGAPKERFTQARKLRNNPTRCEKLLWEELRGKRLNGFKIRRQVIIQGFIADFYCASAKLAIELDGNGHNPQSDMRRDGKIMDANGIITIRFPNSRVYADLPGVLQEIKETIIALHGQRRKDYNAMIEKYYGHG